MYLVEKGVLLILILHIGRNGKPHLHDVTQGKDHYLLLKQLKWKALGVPPTLSIRPPAEGAVSNSRVSPVWKKWGKTGLGNLAGTRMSRRLECISNGSIHPTGPLHQCIQGNLLELSSTQSLGEKGKWLSSSSFLWLKTHRLLDDKWTESTDKKVHGIRF